jgi:restriction system protein
MARQRTNPFEDVVTVASKLPWQAGVALALVSFLILHGLASRPPLTMTGPGQMGTVVVRSFCTTLAMFGQFLLPLAFVLGALVSAFNLVRQKKLYHNVEKRSGVGALNDMSWGDFERLVSEYYRRKGFQVTREGGNGPDGGIDLILHQKGEVYLVQCKQWKAYKVGVQPVREFYGVMASRGAAGGYFVTSGEYTSEARTFVRGLNLELLDGRKLQAMIDMAQQPVLTRVTAGPGSNVAKAAPARKEPMVSPAVQVVQVVPVVPVVPAAPRSPACPQCSAPMSRRMARSGSNVGKEFWGCSTYPKCKGTRLIEELTPAVTAPEPALIKPAPEKSNCPDCGTEMALRKFQSGPRLGEEFYGCVPCKKGWSLAQVG